MTEIKYFQMGEKDILSNTTDWKLINDLLLFYFMSISDAKNN